MHQRALQMVRELSDCLTTTIEILPSPSPLTPNSPDLVHWIDGDCTAPHFAAILRVAMDADVCCH